MKRLTITTRITIRYAVFLIAVSMILMISFFRYFDFHEQSIVEKHMDRVAEEFGSKIFVRGKSFAKASNANYFTENIYLSVYDEEGAFFAGEIPGGIGELPDICVGKTQDYKDEYGRIWYIRDQKLYTKDNADLVYIRGISESMAHEQIPAMMRSFFLIAVPVLIILSVVGSRHISSRALTPMRNLTGVISEIRDEGDVSKRVPVPESPNEMSELIESINGTFDTIEEMIERERRFTADVSHELRTPLTIISTQSEYAMEDPGYTEHALMTIRRESSHMSKLINDLLMISRSDSGRLQPDIRELDIRELLAELAAQASIAGADNNIKATFIDETLAEADGVAEGESAVKNHSDALTIYSDEALLMRILMNLLDNAGKYGKVPDGNIEIRLRKKDESVIITVADDGKGIAAEDQSKIWNRFYRPEETRSRSDSSGLGLAMVDSLTKVLGGSIKIVTDDEKRPGEMPGAVFEIALPLKNTKVQAKT